MSIRKQLINKLPPNLKGLVDLAYNLWWCWHVDSVELFKILDPPLWRSTNSNPVGILREITDERLKEISENEYFNDLYNKTMTHFSREMQTEAEHLWWNTTFSEHKNIIIAYLSMEYGLHNSLHIYSGGLGVLSGDHLKESSDLGVPLIAVGFFYQEGFFTQNISTYRNGWQEEIYIESDTDNLPIEEVIEPDTGHPLIISIELKNTVVFVKVWKIAVGRVTLYLMDTNIEVNHPWFRDLTDRLYGGNSELRLQQEMVLGIGAVRLFNKLKIKPTVWHLNEGHCSFSSIERIHQYIGKGINFDESLAKVRQNTIFTTHTPVPAGHDVFPLNLVQLYFPENIDTLGREKFFSLGTYDHIQGPGFNMTVLGIRTSSRVNSVSSLHEDVTKSMFSALWNELHEKYKEMFKPLAYITNGVHIPSYLSNITKDFLNKNNCNWFSRHDKLSFWEELMNEICDDDIWDLHKRAKEKLIHFIMETSRRKIKNGEWDAKMSLSSGVLLDPEVLTIGFARRFTAYKRATLIFTDFERLKKIVNHPYRPVQIIFSGKAHPADDLGKKLIQEVYNHAINPELNYRIAYLENYDLVIAKKLIQGVDLWLNNPLLSNEASGTSGMKAAINFIPNISILDGWWAEGYDASEVNGWAINSDNHIELDRGAQDWHDAKSLYDLLENEIIPLYYDHKPGKLPYRWIKIMRRAFMTSITQFCAKRMLKEYSEKLYTTCL